jgi:hypothetical protein
LGGLGTGGGGGTWPSPGYAYVDVALDGEVGYPSDAAYGLVLAYGPCGANGGPYDGGPDVGGGGMVTGGGIGPGGGAGGMGAPGGTVPCRVAWLPRAMSTTAPRSTATPTAAGRKPSDTTNDSVSTASSPMTTTSAADVRDRPRPSVASSGDAVSPSAGMSSQPSR